MNKRLNKKGFTLVELIVVLIILALLAAILIPTLIGYIDKARDGRYLSNAKACKDAAQAKFVEQYGMNGEVLPDYPIVSGLTVGVETSGADKGKCKSNNGDLDLVYNAFAKDVLSMAGVDPYFFMVAVGSNQAKINRDTESPGLPMSTFDKYTVYYAVYIETEKARPWYYYNGEWTTTSPRFDVNGKKTFNGNNVVMSGPLKDKRLQYYLIANKNKKFPSSPDNQDKTFTPNFWNWLNAMK